MKPLTLIGLIGLLALRSDAAWITPADFNTNQFSTAGGKISLVNTNPIGTNVFSAAAAIATNGPDLNPLLTTASSLNAANLTGTLSLNAPTATIATNAPDGYRLLSTNSTLNSAKLAGSIDTNLVPKVTAAITADTALSGWPTMTNGADAHIYIAYAADSSGTSFTTNFNSALNYIAFKSTTTALTPPQASDFTGLWKNYKGVSGTNGLNGSNGSSGTNGVNGSAAYVYLAYASDAAGANFTMTFNSALDYIAIRSTTSPIVSPGAGDFAGYWKSCRGPSGTNGAAGATGATGPAGPTGPQGPAGTNATSSLYARIATNAPDGYPLLSTASSLPAANLTGTVPTNTIPKVTSSIAADNATHADSATTADTATTASAGWPTTWNWGAMDFSHIDAVVTNSVAMKVPVFTNTDTGTVFYMILYTNVP